jgi:hypothetical protein
MFKTMKRNWWNVAGQVVCETMAGALTYTGIGIFLFGIKPEKRKYLIGLSTLFSFADSMRGLDLNRKD